MEEAKKERLALLRFRLLALALINLLPMLVVLEMDLKVTRRHVRAGRVQLSGAILAAHAGEEHILCVGWEGLAGLLLDG